MRKVLSRMEEKEREKEIAATNGGIVKIEKIMPTAIAKEAKQEALAGKKAEHKNKPASEPCQQSSAHPQRSRP